MTPEAKAFRASTVQAIKARMQAPNYRILLQADSVQLRTPTCRRWSSGGT